MLGHVSEDKRGGGLPLYRDLLRPIAEVNALGEVVARYVYGDAAGVMRNIGEGLHARLGIGGGFTKIHGGGRLSPRYILEFAPDGSVARTLAPIADDFGNVYLVVDVFSGTVTQRLAYDEHGRVLFDSAPGLFPFGYGGGIYDPDTRHTRFGARDVEHDRGRWLARDPIRFKSGSMNLFLHAGGDPLNALDATGLATYRCERPLRDYDNTSMDDDRKNGPDVSGNPFYHEYTCVQQGKHMICNGHGPRGPTHDVYSPYRCDKTHEDDVCLESCVASRLESNERPDYSYQGDPFGPPNCKDWARTNIAECEDACGR